ncbi:ferritin-like domain-containing protein [Paraburkholderia rhizosphaerae]|nr:ferritin-like domain-containing protein [Paraburkholderia rhizosphaerae]
MLFPSLFDSLERARWNMYSDIPWNQFDRSLINESQLHGVKMNAILEWSSMPTAEMFLRDNQGDTDFSAFISIWFFEEQKHSLALLEYLRRFAPNFLPTEAELAAVRFPFDPAPALDSLVLHFCGEVRLNNWYRCAREYHREPVIRAIYQLLANDEARHARAYYRYMQRALAKQPAQARASFSKIGVLMTNPRMNRAMHPTNLHVSRTLFPDDTVNGRLPDPDWLMRWLDEEIHFDKQWEQQVERGILQNLSALFGQQFDSPRALRQYQKSLAAH